MTQGKQLDALLRAFERVGVDPNTISAGLAVPRDDVMRVLQSLPNDAGPAAFLSKLRIIMTQGAVRDNGELEDRA